jgi:UDP-N-acetyl-D-glucosamine dehydrogenase
MDHLLMEKLAGLIQDRKAKVAVIGQGYVGLPLSMAFSRVGFSVIGLEADPDKVASLEAGRSYVPDISDEVLAEAQAAGYEATSDAARLGAADAILITVPTPYTKTKQPDMTYVQQAARAVSRRLRPGQLVILESTTYPGTTESLLLPELETGALKAGEDFEVAYSPERIEPGNRKFGLANTPKVVGGMTQRATELAAQLYGTIVERVVTVSSPAAAEMTKLLENTYRHVNIALANEMAQLCHRMGINVWEVVGAAATKPFGYSPFFPGPGVGGHCIPIDPYYLVWKAQEHETVARLVELAGQINETMPDWVVERIADILNDRGRSLRGSRILLVGVSYKKDVPDLREAPALKVLEKLHRKGAHLLYHDPWVPSLPWHYGALQSVPLSADELAQIDCAVLLTDHTNLDLDTLVEYAPAVLDTRNALSSYRRQNIVRL